MSEKKSGATPFRDWWTPGGFVCRGALWLGGWRFRETQRGLDLRVPESQRLPRTRLSPIWFSTLLRARSSGFVFKDKLIIDAFPDPKAEGVTLRARGAPKRRKKKKRLLCVY